MVQFDRLRGFVLHHPTESDLRPALLPRVGCEKGIGTLERGDHILVRVNLASQSHHRFFVSFIAVQGDDQRPRTVALLLRNVEIVIEVDLLRYRFFDDHLDKLWTAEAFRMPKPDYATRTRRPKGRDVPRCLDAGPSSTMS